MSVINIRGVAKEDCTEKDVELYRMAAELGNADAQFNMGAVYYEGLGGEAQDYGEAFSWWLKSAGQGNADAQFALGCLYRDGQGTEQDYGEAVEWWKKAAA